MSNEGSGEKTEKATPRKRRETREKGEVAKSRELPSVAVLLASLLGLVFFGSFMLQHLQLLMKDAFTMPNPAEMGDVDRLVAYGKSVIVDFFLIVAPMLAAVFVVAICSNVAQVGLLLSTELIKPKLSKLDPVKGLGRLFSKQAAAELFKTLLKLIIVAGIVYASIVGKIEELPNLGNLDVSGVFQYLSTVVFSIFMNCTLALLPLVLLDWAFQKWQFEERIKMSKQEVKEEHKRSEGDPQIKARIKGLQMEMARKRMMQAVPDADVVITNPTHLAVALSYRKDAMSAPRVIAKGADLIARRIKALAAENNVPIVENRPLARDLYTMVDIDQEIPPALYHAVAEVMAYIYRLNPGGAARPAVDNS